MSEMPGWYNILSQSIQYAETAFDKIQCPFLIKNSRQTRNRRENFVNLIKGSYKKPTVNITHKGERWDVFPSRSGTQQGMSAVTMFVLHCTTGSSQ